MNFYLQATDSLTTTPSENPLWSHRKAAELIFSEKNKTQVLQPCLTWIIFIPKMHLKRARFISLTTGSFIYLRSGTYFIFTKDDWKI